MTEKNEATTNWAPARDGLTCNVCGKPVHYDKKLYIHMHDDAAAGPCNRKDRHG